MIYLLIFNVIQNKYNSLFYIQFKIKESENEKEIHF